MKRPTNIFDVFFCLFFILSISPMFMRSMAYMQPDVTRNSLMKKVSNGMILEDTGIGGSWPCSTDRVVWAIAAWQLYLVTGDNDWLRQSYAIIWSEP